MPNKIKLVPCLWFDSQAEEAARFYCSIFPNSKIVRISRYTKAGYEHHKKPAGSVLVVDFELDGHPCSALNGGPVFKFGEAISLQVICETQQDIDHYWSKLSEGTDPNAQMCGWLKDRYGLSWQVVPAALREMLIDPDTSKAERVMTALLQMKKLDLGALQRAFDSR